VRSNVVRVYVTGADGMLCSALRAELSADRRTTDWPVLGVSIGDFDIADADAVAQSIEEFRPAVVFPAAASAISVDSAAAPDRLPVQPAHVHRGPGEGADPPADPHAGRHRDDPRREHRVSQLVRGCPARARRAEPAAARRAGSRTRGARRLWFPRRAPAQLHPEYAAPGPARLPDADVAGRG